MPLLKPTWVQEHRMNRHVSHLNDQMGLKGWWIMFMTGLDAIPSSLSEKIRRQLRRARSWWENKVGQCQKCREMRHILNLRSNAPGLTGSAISVRGL
jgi:hypothetical protein